jgi:hypothetical protein
MLPPQAIGDVDLQGGREVRMQRQMPLVHG